jgi:hypothetical protein
MAREFFSATAEQVVAAVEAVVANTGGATKADFVAEFSDLPPDQAEAALDLGTDLGFLSKDGTKYEVASPLCRFLSTPNQMQKAAVLRVLLESYTPFVVFRQRLEATELAAQAAQQTKTLLDLDAHREEIKDTLVSLGTYSHALVTEGGGRYRPEGEPAGNPLQALLASAQDATSAEALVRKQLGAEAVGTVSRDEVIVPLADAAIRARDNDSRGAVVSAGNAVESYLDGLATRLTVNLTGATGINAKLDRLGTGNTIPKKLIQVGKYLGNIRNAADHGVDPDVGASWSIREATGVEYVLVACSFIAAATHREKGHAPEI